MSRSNIIFTFDWISPQLFAGIVLGTALLGASVLRAEDVGDLRLRDGSHTKTHFTAPGYLTLTEWQDRRAQLRRQILVSAGLWPLTERAAPKMRSFGQVTGKGYTVSRVAFESLPGFWVGANIYLPETTTPGAKLPAVLVPHGHWKHGRVEDSPEYSVPALCVNLAAQGYVVLAYDMVGYNDTRQVPHKFGDSDEERAWAFHPLGLQLWDSIRAMDLLEALPQVDASRIAATGASGGGTQTFLLAGVDDRVRVSIPAAMVSATFQGDDDCEEAPGLRVKASNMEISALVAPRPQLLIAATGDWTKQTPELEFPAIRSIYQLYGEQEKIDYAYIDAGHNYNRQSREAAYAFLWKNLAGHEGPAPRETVDFAMEPEDLLIGNAMNALTEGVGIAEVFARWRERGMSARGELTVEEKRGLLRETLALTWPTGTRAIPFNAAYVLDYGSGERVPARWIPSGMSKTLIVHEKGSEAALHSDAALEALRRGDSLLLIDVFNPTVDAHIRHGDYLTYHRSDEANRIQDVLTALSFLRQGSDPVTLACPGRAALWCAVAAAVAPGPVILKLDNAYIAEKYAEVYSKIPGFRNAGGIATINALLQTTGHGSATGE